MWGLTFDPLWTAFCGVGNRGWEMGSHGEKTQGPSGGFEKLPTTEWLTGFYGVSSAQIFSGTLEIDLSNVKAVVKST